MSKPALNARYRPQAWVNDYAIDIDGAHDFDAAEAMLSFTAEDIRTFEFNSYDTDAIAEFYDLRNHSGPFEVDIDENDWLEFWRTLGVADPRKINDEQLTAAKELYGEATP